MQFLALLTLAVARTAVHEELGLLNWHSCSASHNTFWVGVQEYALPSGQTDCSAGGGLCPKCSHCLLPDTYFPYCALNLTRNCQPYRCTGPVIRYQTSQQSATLRRLRLHLRQGGLPGLPRGPVRRVGRRCPSPFWNGLEETTASEICQCPEASECRASDCSPARPCSAVYLDARLVVLAPGSPQCSPLSTTVKTTTTPTTTAFTTTRGGKGSGKDKGKKRGDS